MNQWCWPDSLHCYASDHGIHSFVASFLVSRLQVFEEDALSWEDKLNRINNLFEVWQDVQRRWVYLDGIFSGSADIKHLLPVETSRFGRYGYGSASFAVLCSLSISISFQLSVCLSICLSCLCCYYE